MTNSVLARLAVLISANTAAFQKSLLEAQKSLNSFKGNITKLAGSIGLAFGAREVASFGLEVGKLAGQAEGVRAAFERLPNNVKLMQELKEATGGTVSELDLMKRAVQAANFDISLAALPRLLEFATLRAQQTGQSVDYLVDSIVTGIGRKSKLILDNLGISAVQLNEALGGVTTGVASIGEVADAVGKIAEDNLKNMAGFAENTATKVQRLEASWGNMKVTIGNIVNDAGLPEWIDSINEKLNELNEKLQNGTTMKELEDHLAMFNKTFGERGQRTDPASFFEAMKDLEAHAERLGKKLLLLEDSGSGFIKMMVDTRSKPTWINAVDEETKQFIETLETLRATEAELLALREKIDVSDRKRLQTNAQEILFVRERIKNIEKMLKMEFKHLPFIGLDKSGADFMSALGLDPDSIDKKIKKIIASIQNLPAALTDVKTKILDIGPLISAAIMDMAEAIGNAFSGSREFGKDMIKAVAKFAQQLGALFIATGVAEMAFQSGNPYAMIAAGVALVALGAAINGMMAKQSKGSKALDSTGSSGPGYRPSEMSVNVAGKVRGYDMALVDDREFYRRSRVG